MPTETENPTEETRSPEHRSTRGVGTPTGSTRRALAACGVAAPILLVAVTLALAELTPGYSHVANTISELGMVGAPYATPFTATFVLAGLLIVAFAVGLHRGIGDARTNHDARGPALVAAFGVFALAGTGLVPLDPEPMAPVNLVHLAVVLVGFLALAAGMYRLSERMAGDPTWRGHARVTRWSSVALAVLFATWVLALFFVPLETGEAPNGALQRPFVVVALLWVAVTAIRLFRQTN